MTFDDDPALSACEDVIYYSFPTGAATKVVAQCELTEGHLGVHASGTYTWGGSVRDEWHGVRACVTAADALSEAMRDHGPGSHEVAVAFATLRARSNWLAEMADAA